VGLRWVWEWVVQSLCLSSSSLLDLKLQLALALEAFVAWECLPWLTQLPLRLWEEGRQFDKLPLPMWNGGKLVGERFRAGRQALGRGLASRRRHARRSRARPFGAS
jgi:hypothetical protein